MREYVHVRGTMTSGGGSLAPHLDDFFEALGINLHNVYGLKETSPFIACRNVVRVSRLVGQLTSCLVATLLA